MFCVIKDQKFKQTAKRLDISEAKLEEIVHKYINSHPKGDFPSDDYINSVFRKDNIVSSDTYDASLIVWRDKYSSPIEVNTLDEANRIKEEISDFFSSDAVVIKPLNNGNYRVSISMPKVAAASRAMYQRGPIVYNKEQKEAIDAAVRHIRDVYAGRTQQKFFTIQGKAGTGKTTIVNEIIRQAFTGFSSYQRPYVIMGAPSHKATAVLKGKINDSIARTVQLTNKTVAGMLGLKPNNNGEYVREPGKVPPINNASLVIIDEASMVNEEHYEMIKEAIERKKIPVLFIGDVGQLPPVRTESFRKKYKVSQDAPSPAFADEDIPTAKLITRVRQGESSPVLDYADQYWDYSQEQRTDYPNDLNATSTITDEGALIVQNGEVDMVKQLLPLFEEAKRTGNPNLVKIVPYTTNSKDNKESAVDRYNRLIREQLYPGSTTEHFEIGDLVIFNDTYGDETGSIPNSFESAVTGIRECESSLPTFDEDLGLQEVKRVYVQFSTPRGTSEVPALVPTLKNRMAHLNNLKKIAKYCRKHPRTWSKFWNYKNLYAANIGYAYAIDSHKSQGSTYDVVAVDAVDINGVQLSTLKTKAQSIYTALTRASNITIVSSNTTNESTIYTDIKAINDRINAVKNGQEVSEDFTPSTEEGIFTEVTEKDIPKLIKGLKKKQDKAPLPTVEKVEVDSRTVNASLPEVEEEEELDWDDPASFEDKDEEPESVSKSPKSVTAQQRTYQNFVAQQSQLNSIISFDAKNHIYKINGRQTDYSITQFRDFILEREVNDNDYLEISSRVGTSHDAVLRDFFAGVSSNTYPNLTYSQVKSVRKEALKLKKRLIRQLSKNPNGNGEDLIFITDENLLRVAGIINYDGKDYTVAGTMDMVVIDADGNITIVDFKTKRANVHENLTDEQEEEYALQVSLYGALTTSSSSLEGKLKETEIAQFNIKYENPNDYEYSYKGQQVYVEVGEESLKIEEAVDRGNSIYTPGTLYKLTSLSTDLDEMGLTISPIKTSLQQRAESKVVAKETETESKELEGNMTGWFGKEKVEGVNATSTLGAILEGKKTADTRFGNSSDHRIGYYKKAKVGDIITWKDGRGKEVKVRVTSPLRKLTTDTNPEGWSAKEGWSVDHFNKVVLPRIKKGEAWQIEFELIQNEKEGAKIEINSHSKKYGLLSNFGDKAFTDDEGRTFPTVEHYFQWCKAIHAKNYKMANTILKAPTPKAAKYLGSHKLEMTKDQINIWDKKKSRNVMKKGMRMAFEQNEEAKNLLLSTGKALLTHKLGGPFADILMELREEFGGYGKPQAIKEVREAAKKEAKEAQKAPKANGSSVTKVISGGQTSVDTLGLEVAKELGIETGGTITPGFVREKGVDSYTKSQLKELGLEEISPELQGGKSGKEFYLPRTEQNVLNSDGTVYFATDEDSAGKIATERFAKKHGKPFLLNPTAEELRQWIAEKRIQTLNIAGNRGSKLKNGDEVRQILREGLSIRPKADSPLHIEKLDDRYSPATTSDVEAFNEKAIALRKQGWHVEFYKKKSRDGSIINDVMTISIEGNPKKGFFELVKDVEDNNYSVHFKTKSKKVLNETKYAEEALEDSEKENLFKALIFAIPDGGIVSTWGELSKGGIAAFDSLARRSGGTLVKVADRTLLSKDKESTMIPVYKKLSEDEFIENKVNQAKISNVSRKKETTKFEDDYFGIQQETQKVEPYTGVFTITLNEPDASISSRPNLLNGSKDADLKRLLLSLPYSSIVSLSTNVVNANYLYTLLSLLEDSRMFAVTGNETISIDPNSIEGNIAAEYARENKDFPYDAKTGTLKVPRFTVGYAADEIKKRASYARLMSSDLINQEQLRALSKAAVYKVSEFITMLQTYPTAYEQLFGTTSKKDFTQMSRIEIIREIGLTNLFNKVRDRVFDSEVASQDTSESTIDKMDLIYENWDAFIELGYDTLIGLEEIALNNKHESSTEIKNDLDDTTEETDESIIQELFGSSVEHWQVGFRQVSAFNSLSTMIKRVMDSLYNLDADGNRITDEFGLDSHLSAQEAVSKILHFTQGALSLDATDASGNLLKNSMVYMLKEHLAEEPWLTQVIELLEDKYNEKGELVKRADEQFKSQFYSNFKKYFQKYSITVKTRKKVGNKYVDVVNTKVINESAFSDTLLNESKAKEASFALGYFKLRTKEGNINTEALDKLRTLSEKLEKAADKTEGKWKKMSEILDLNDYHKTIEDVLDLLDISSPPSESLYRIFGVKKNLNDLNRHLAYLIKNIDKTTNITDNRDYQQIVQLVSKEMGLEMEAVSYEAGKLYYSYVLPSYLGRLVGKLNQSNMSDEEYDAFLQNEYLRYRWFYKDGKVRCHWLDRLRRSKEAKQMFQHVTSLHFLGTEYPDKTPTEYIASMMRMYFYDNNKKWAYYRVPMLSNKPSEEYIRFERISTAYESTILGYMWDVFTQELDRIQAVRQRQSSTNKDQKIKNFDTKGLQFVFEDYLQKYLDGTWEDDYKDLTKEQKELSTEYQEAKEFSELLNKKLDTGLAEDSPENGRLMLLFNTMTKKGFDENYAKAKQQWIDEGFITLDENGKIAKIFNNTKLGEEDLREFFWNDAFASTQILQLTITDLAYYADAEDLQKRLAQLHAPGMQANILAKYQGEDGEMHFYTEDGIERTMYIKDDKVKSNTIENLIKAVEQIIADTPEDRKKYVREQLENVIKEFKKINFADAQGYSCPSSYRKKLGVFGNWDAKMENAYQILTHPEKYPDVQITDLLDILWQPLKPFVYTQISKPGYNDLLPEIKMGVQNKNSEYTLLIADAIMRRGRVANKLSAIYDFMEESQHNSDGTLNGKGIDTVQFESTVKVGLTGVIDLNDERDKDGNIIHYKTEQEIREALEKAYIYDNGNKTYNQDYVHEIPFEDYIIQQNVPDHFREHQQAHGSQDRILTFADILDVDPKTGEENYLTIDGEKVTVREAKENYFKAIADNIEQSKQELISRFHLDSSDMREVNVAISRVLKDAILKDARFGSDLLWACDTDESGEFNIPLSDPIQSNRIQQLLNSVIKNTINKQEIAGGPVVQVSSWGVSDELVIRYKTEDDKLLLTRREFEEHDYPSDYSSKYKSSDGYIDYNSYIEDQAGVAYFEAYVPIQDSAIARDFTKKDANGNEYIDVAAMEEANPDLLNMVGYRIPTESKYSMVPIKVKGFLPRNSGEGVMLPAEITTMSGSDFDIDKLYIMRYAFRRRIKNGNVTYEKPTSGKDYRDNLIISTQLAVLRSKQVQKQLFTPGNFDAPKHYGYLISYVQNEALATGRPVEEIWEEAKNWDNDTLKAKNKTSKNIIFNNVQVQFHKQNMTAGKLIGIFAQANVSHAFISLVERTSLNIPQENAFKLNGIQVGGDDFFIDEVLTRDKSINISNNLAALLAASVDAVKDPILNLININIDTANLVTSLLRMGFNMQTVSLLCGQPVIKDLIKEYNIKRADGIYVDINSIIDKKIELMSDDTQLITDIETNDAALIANLDGSNEVTNYMVLQIFKRMLDVSDTFGDITHMARYNSVTSAVGPFASNTMLLRIKDAAFDANPMIGDRVKEAVNNPILAGFRDSANYIERKLLGEHLIQAGTKFEEALDTLGKKLGFSRGVPAKVANAFSNFFMSWYVNAGRTSIFDLSYENRRYMLQDFPKHFIKQKEKIKDNILINSIQYVESDREQFPFLKLNTRGISSTLSEDFKQAWVSLYENPSTRGLALRLVEYNFFRGSFGFSPKTFMNLTPNIIKRNLCKQPGASSGEYINVLNSRDSAVEIGDFTDMIIYQFILHNERLIVDRYKKLDDYSPSEIDDPVYGNCIICERKADKKDTLQTQRPFIEIDNTVYFVVNNADIDTITLKQVDLLGGDSQGFEMSTRELFPKSVFDPNYKASRGKSEGASFKKSNALEETLGVLVDQLFTDADSLDEIIGTGPKSAINVINKELSSRGIDYKLSSDQKTKKAMYSLLKKVKEVEGESNIREILNKAEKTITDLNLCS